jgi:hypothetical protein
LQLRSFVKRKLLGWRRFWFLNLRTSHVLHVILSQSAASRSYVKLTFTQQTY